MNETGESPVPAPAAGFAGFTPSVLELASRRFLIRRAVESDLPMLIALLHDDVLGAQREGAGADLEAAGADLEAEGAEPKSPVSTEDFEPYRRAFELIGADANQLLVAIEEEPSGVVVGTLQLSLLPSLSRRGSTRLQIEAVRVGRQARGIGLGTAVFEWAHECGRRFGASLAQLTTDRSRHDAQRFYSRLGYTASHEGLKLDLGD